MPILAASTSENESTVVLLIISPYQQTAEPFGAIYCDWYPLLQNYSGEKQQGILRIMVLRVLGVLGYLQVFLKQDIATSGSIKKASWSKQGGGLVRMMPKEQNSVAEDARYMRELCFGQQLGEKAFAASGFAVHVLGLHILWF